MEHSCGHSYSELQKSQNTVEDIQFGTTVDTPCSKFPIELGITLGEIKKKE